MLTHSRVNRNKLGTTSHDVGPEKYRESGEETSRRRQQGLGRKRFSKSVLDGDDFKLRGRKQVQLPGHRWKLHFQGSEDGFSFLLLLFGGGNGLAQAAGVFTIESFANRARKRIAAEVACEHGRPCDGLERSPVQTRRKYEGDHHQNFSTANKHGDKLTIPHGSTRAGFQFPNHFSAIQTSVPLGRRLNMEIKSSSTRWTQPCEAGAPRDFWSPVPWM